MAFMMDTVSAVLRITCDYETTSKHSFLVDLTKEGPIVCPHCHQPYIVFGGFNVEYRPEDYKGMPPRPGHERTE